MASLCVWAFIRMIAQYSAGAGAAGGGFVLPGCVLSSLCKWNPSGGGGEHISSHHERYIGSVLAQDRVDPTGTTGRDVIHSGPWASAQYWRQKRCLVRNFFWEEIYRQFVGTGPGRPNGHNRTGRCSTGSAAAAELTKTEYLTRY